MKQASRYLLIATLGLSFSGCATNKSLTTDAAYEQYPLVAELNRKLEKAREDDLAVLSPEYFESSSKTYSEALEQAVANNPKATNTANESLSALNRANQNATVARDLLEDVIKVRNKARAANAQSINPDAYAEAEDEFLTLTRYIEEGKIEKAKAGRADAIRAYTHIELAALKDTTVDKARDAINQAKKKNIDDIAPKTFAKAMDEYNLALQTLDADRTNTDKASVHAGRAVWHVQRATQIADVIAHFDASDYDAEDKVLWYQDQIGRIVAPVQSDVAYNLPNKEMVKGLNLSIANLQSEKTKLAADLSNISLAKSKELQAMKESSAAEKKRQQALAAKFNFVQTLYDNKEAEVYRQQDNVLIRAHGFAFNSGASEIDARNFALMNKIIESLSQFPDAKIVVSGHTDSTGNENLNQELSQQRAEKVAQFLTQVGKIPANRIQYVGYGKSRPVANNETPEGRAANRRVEILIVNS